MTIRQTSFVLRHAFMVACIAPCFALPSLASAQADVRDLRPAMILMVDTSGSMERLPQCECTTASCNECLPQCSGNAGAGDTRNRWATVLEALTGSWSDTNFSCSAVSRASFNGDDATYPLPHYTNPGTTNQNQDGILDTYVDRAKFALMTFDGVPTTTNGAELIRVADWTPAFIASTQGRLGGYSYGFASTTFNLPSGGATVPQWTAPSYPFRFPGCGEANGYYINVGARRPADTAHGEVIPGGLITVGADTTYQSINQAIQDSLLSVRPYGPTPIAGMLEDLRFYLQNDTSIGPARNVSGATVGDTFFECRKRYALLITDGYPNADMRGAPFNCATAEPGTNGFPNGRASWCPYDLPEEIAERLCQPTGTNAVCTGGDLDGLFVVGFNVNDTDAAEVLNDIALSGGTQHAYFATDLASLRASIATILDVAASGTTSRTTPAFAAGSLIADTQTSSQFSTGFEIDDPGAPWTGVLERHRFACDADTNLPAPQTITAADRFHDILNAQSTRTLYTVVPSNVAHVSGHLIGPSTGVLPLGSVTGTASGNGNHGHGQGGTSCTNGNSGGNGGGGNGGGGNGGGGGNCGGGNSGGGNSGGGNSGGGNSGTIGDESNLALTQFTLANNALTPQHFSVSTAADRDAIINWVRGDNGARSVRLGDIYHSSPVVVGPPNADIADESYNEFRRSDVVANRPTVLYVGSNDGVLHAFAAENITITGGPHSPRTITAGTELWGFVPPAIFPRLNSARSSHQWLVDGTPVVKDIFYRRLPQAGASAGSYHTVLLFALRGGGGAYIALDVTDPLAPTFLWQFGNTDIGETLGTPALGQILVEVATNQFEERAIVLLPGGSGEDLTSTCSPNEIVNGQFTRPMGCPSNGIGTPPANGGTINARSHQKCWSTRGRHLYMVDPSTGQLLSHLDDSVFGAPLSGGFSLFTGDVGTIASRAYFTDGDGVLWRLDLSNPDMSEWSASPVFDMFHGAGGADGQPSFGPPVISTDSSGNVVVLQATGNIDTLDAQVANRIVSVTDTASFSVDGTASFEATLNWEVALPVGELVTGPLQLFDSRVYFATFKSATSALDACDFGEGHLWGLDYRQSSGSFAPVGVMTNANGQTVTKLGPYDNQLVLGVSITQNMTCADWDSVQRFDPYVPTPQNVQRASQVNQGGFRLVAQVSGAGSIPSGGSVSEISIDLPSPLSTTRIQGWAGHAD